MCALLLLLMAGAADCARPHLLHYGQEYQTSPDYELQPLLPFPLSREYFHTRPVKTNQPSYETYSFAKQSEVEEKHVPRLRTDFHSSPGIEQMRDYGVKNNKNNRGATDAALQEPAKKRNQETTVRHNEPNETQLVNVNSSDNGDEEESTWVWGTSDTSEAKNTTAVDDLDDRTSIAGANCPTGQVKVDGKCVDKH